MTRKVKVTVWCEHNQDRYELVSRVYPDGMHQAIAEGFLEEHAFEVRTATQDEAEKGLSREILDQTDVLVWWSHLDNNELDDRLAFPRLLSEGNQTCSAQCGALAGAAAECSPPAACGWIPGRRAEEEFIP